MSLGDKDQNDKFLIIYQNSNLQGRSQAFMVSIGLPGLEIRGL